MMHSAAAGQRADLRGRRRGKLQAGLERLDLELARLRVRRRTERGSASASGREGVRGRGERERKALLGRGRRKGRERRERREVESA